MKKLVSIAALTLGMRYNLFAEKRKGGVGTSKAMQIKGGIIRLIFIQLFYANGPQVLHKEDGLIHSKNLPCLAPLIFFCH